MVTKTRTMGSKVVESGLYRNHSSIDIDDSDFRSSVYWLGWCFGYSRVEYCNYFLRICWL